MAIALSKKRAAQPFSSPEVAAVVAQLAGRKTLVLSGAGISTDSGIPDYRSPERATRRRDPMRFQEFVGSESARRRYWARSYVGWQRVADARPNEGHHALAQLEQLGLVSATLTQNVDGLHQAAGSRRVLELHGSLAAVRCLACRALSSRRRLQRRLEQLNPGAHTHATEPTPDGDAELAAEAEASFCVPLCEHCGGPLKPDVVFFGENVPASRVERAYDLLHQADALLVVGTSLTVFSGYRFVRRAAAEGKPVVILNDGATRGDAEATLKHSGRLGSVLPELAAYFGF